MSAPGLWEVSHLREVPGTYDQTRDVIPIERTTAGRIFNAFGLTLNQWRHAASSDGGS